MPHPSSLARRICQQFTSALKFPVRPARLRSFITFQGALLVPLLAFTGGCRTARIEPFGEAKLEALCADTKRCGARGDSVVNLLKNQKTARTYLVPDKGPEQLLGKVAPKRKVDSVMSTCGAEIAANDWLSAPEVIRQFKLGAEGKRELRQRLHAYLARRVSALTIPEKAGAEASVKAVSEAVDVDEVSWVGQTYWLSDAAFERRVAQCGEEERENIIYSITVLSPSEAFQVDVEAKLQRALNAKLGAPPAKDAGVPEAEDSGLQTEPTAPAEDGQEGDALQRHDTIARDVVRALARDTRVLAALGFDDT